MTIPALTLDDICIVEHKRRLRPRAEGTMWCARCLGELRAEGYFDEVTPPAPLVRPAEPPARALYDEPRIVRALYDRPGLVVAWFLAIIVVLAWILPHLGAGALV